MPDEKNQHKFFNEATAAVFAAIAGCIVPSEPGSPGADSPAALALADRALADRPAPEQKLLATFLGAIQALPRLRYGRTFTQLPRDKQAKVLAFLESNRFVPKLRQGFFGVKAFALLGYYGQEDCFAELGYPGPRQDAPFYRLRRAEQAR